MSLQEIESSTKLRKVVEQGKMYPIRASYHSSACTKIKISKDGCFALSSGRDGKVNILNAFTGELLGDYTTSPT